MQGNREGEIDMLMTLEDMKIKLKIDPEDDTYDVFLTDQINIVSEAMEIYCGRKFLRANYVEEFYRDEIKKDRVTEIYLHHYPVANVSSIIEDEEILTDYRLVKDTGLIRKNKYGFFSSSDSMITVRYSAGFQELPYTLQSVLVSLVGERYGKEQAGVSLSFGSDVQRISIPGTISIDYDYTLENNSQTIALGVILGSQINVLDQFKSERKVVGVLRNGYVNQ